ncbi:MAG TPA: tetratricopeptide repeat protein [Rectinemataceae bacterium]|nr:tetratricopeptide repeat protein [Rectinemataceae bacterium]
MKKNIAMFFFFAAVLTAAFALPTKEELKALIASAEKGNADAQCNLGVIYFTGEGAPQNIPEAIRLFTAAAERKNLDAQRNLGWIYRHTEGYLDPKKAAKFYDMAARQGDAESQYLLGLMYKEGEGLAKNDKEAVLWLGKAAAQKYPEAQSALGDMYEKGRGVAKDKIEALKWYIVAKKSGDSIADMFIDSIKSGMSASQIAEAEKRAAKY